MFGTKGAVMKLRLSFIFFLTLGLVGCSSEYEQKSISTSSSDERRDEDLGKFLGEDTLRFGGPKKREQEDTGLGVNSHLWRAALDTISFMPIASADPFGGVIITDWFSPPNNPQERLKVNVFILDRQLRSDGLKVSVFRQELRKNGGWVDSSVSQQTIKELEETILTRARHYKIKAKK